MMSPKEVVEITVTGKMNTRRTKAFFVAGELW
jgi:hypothetical protein